MSRTRRHPVFRAARAFTLVEMLIVIGIIVLLLGLTVTVSTGLLRGSEVRQTENALRILDAALLEWETVADRELRVGIGDGFDVDIGDESGGSEIDPETGDPTEITRRLLTLLDRNTTSRAIISDIDIKFLVRETDEDGHDLRLRDAWDEEIVVVLPGRAWVVGDSFTANDDGTVQWPFEDRFGIVVNRRPFFVSAGPDGEFGHLHLDTAESSLSDADKDDIDLAADNVYSYPVLRTRP